MTFESLIHFFLGSRKPSNGTTTVVDHRGITNEQSLGETYNEIQKTNKRNLVINIRQHGTTIEGDKPWLRYNTSDAINTEIVLKECLNNVPSCVEKVEINLFACKQKFKEEDLINLCKNYKFNIQINYNTNPIYSYRLCRNKPDTWCSIGLFKNHAIFTYNANDLFTCTSHFTENVSKEEPPKKTITERGYIPTSFNSKPYTPTSLEDTIPPYVQNFFTPKTFTLDGTCHR